MNLMDIDEGAELVQRLLVARTLLSYEKELIEKDAELEEYEADLQALEARVLELEERLANQAATIGQLHDALDRVDGRYDDFVVDVTDDAYSYPF